jgi:hypothetical protein
LAVHVKLRNVERFRASVAALLDALAVDAN